MIKTAPPDVSWITAIAVFLLVILMARGTWRGYKRGPLRQLAGPFALTVGLIVGWLVGRECGHNLFHGTSYPWLLRGATGVVLVSCATGILVYGVSWWLGKRPEGMDEAESPILGSIVGCWTGLLYFSLLVLVITTWASLQELISGPEVAEQHWVVQTRNDLAETPITSWLKTWSPLPDKQSHLIRQLRQLMGNPEARKRLVNTPEVRALAAYPSLYQALEDKKVRELLNNKDLSGFIEHPKVKAVLADEALQMEIEKIDLELIFEKALKNTHP